MAENVGDEKSRFGSVTSSQRSFLKNCPYAAPKSPPPPTSSDGVVETDLDRTEILGNPISPAVVRTPVLSFSSSASLNSINDEDVFRTPPENASLSSAAESVMKPRGGSKLKSPSSKTETTHVSASPYLPEENVRVLEKNRLSDCVEPGTEVTSLYTPPSFAAGDVRVTGKHPDLDSPSPISVAAGDVRVPGKHSDIDSPSSIAIDRMTVKENQPISESAANNGAAESPSPGKDPNLVSSSPSATEGIKITETENPGENAIPPFKEVIEALLRNNGENLNERDEKVSYIDILEQFGLKFP